MSTAVQLRGMTWNHSRGYTPMVATAQRFSELNPDVKIEWDKRSLQEFADQPIDTLASQYDLLVIDHPWAGFAAESEAIVAVDELLDDAFLLDQAANSVGRSHESYAYDGHQWALAIDAAAPVAAYRPDLLERADAELPRTWEDVLALARRGLVCCPGIPLDAFCNFVNLCASLGSDPFSDTERVVDRKTGLESLDRLRELVSLVPKRFFELNPIRTLEAMSVGDEFAYCPWTYGYSNYARRGYATRIVKFADVASISRGTPPSTLLGGTGLAISARCPHREVAAEYARFVASPTIQRGLYFDAGGQPGHRIAWLDEQVNRDSSNFFRDTLPTLDRAFVRPRYSGYLRFQDCAGDPIHAWLRDGGDAQRVLDTLDELYRASQGARR